MSALAENLAINPSVDETLLPPRLRQLVEVLGVPATLALLEAYGGTRVEFPEHADRSTKFCQVLNSGQLIALVASPLRGQRIELPKADKIQIQLRNQYIRSKKGELTKAELALELNVCTRTIQTIWNSDAPQATVANNYDLFE